MESLKNIYRQFRDDGGWFLIALIGSITTVAGEIMSNGAYKPNFVTDLGQVILLLGFYMALSAGGSTWFPLFGKVTYWYRPSWASEDLPKEKLPTKAGYVFFLVISLLCILFIRWQWDQADRIHWSNYVLCAVLFWQVLRLMWGLITSLRAIHVWRRALRDAYPLA